MITISLCMIVKNEERILKRCLDSVKDLMDEIIIVDTGSTDRTKEIACEYTDKIYDFTWIDDFAAARNFSFSKATKDYIYVADADEILDEENQMRFRTLKEMLLPEIEIVQMMYCNQLAHNTTYNFDEELRPKLYKRKRDFVWQDAIHEGVRLEPVIYDSDIRIMHCPENNHSGRDFGIFKRIFEKGYPFSKKMHNMYAKELFIAGKDEDFLMAKDFFEGSVLDVSRSQDEIREASCVLAKAARIEGNAAKLLKYASKELVDSPSAEICYELGEFYYQLEDYNEAIIWFYNAAFETVSSLNIHYAGDYPRKRLAQCYRKLDIIEQAEYYEALAEEWGYDIRS